MIHKVRLSIPSAHRDIVTRVASLSDQAFESLRLILQSADPRHSVSTLSSAVSSRLAEFDIDSYELLGMLTGIRAAAESHSSTISEVASSISADATARKFIPPDSSQILQNRLERLLELRSVAVTSKTFYLSTEYRDRVQGSRIITDIRPVFEDVGDDPSQAPVPSAAIVMHTLHLEIAGQDDIYVALGPDELTDLKNQIDRALKKAERLWNFLELSELKKLDGDGPSI